MTEKWTTQNIPFLPDRNIVVCWFGICGGTGSLLPVGRGFVPYADAATVYASAK